METNSIYDINVRLNFIKNVSKLAYIHVCMCTCRLCPPHPAAALSWRCQQAALHFSLAEARAGIVDLRSIPSPYVSSTTGGVVSVESLGSWGTVIFSGKLASI